MMHEHGKSDSPIVPTKPVNKTAPAVAESVEERGLTKGNVIRQNTPRTQSRNKEVSSALDRVREAAKRDKNGRFTALLHHVTIAQLRKAFLSIRKNAGAGVDGMTWRQYQKDLEANLEDLHSRVQRGAYRAKASRRVYIPKRDGRMRPLGIPTVTS